MPAELAAANAAHATDSTLSPFVICIYNIAAL
jgi:hypothetical protein